MSRVDDDDVVISDPGISAVMIEMTEAQQILLGDMGDARCSKNIVSPKICVSVAGVNAVPGEKAVYVRWCDVTMAF